MSKYFNPYTDFGFKKLFGTELNKDQWDITNAMEDSEKKGFFKGKAEGEKLGLEKGLEKGRAEGRADAMREIARAMKQHGDDINYIVSVTGLTKDEILRNE